MRVSVCVCICCTHTSDIHIHNINLYTKVKEYCVCTMFRHGRSFALLICAALFFFLTRHFQPVAFFVYIQIMCIFWCIQFKASRLMRAPRWINHIWWCYITQRPRDCWWLICELFCLKRDSPALLPPKLYIYMYNVFVQEERMKRNHKLWLITACVSGVVTDYVRWYIMNLVWVATRL